MSTEDQTQTGGESNDQVVAGSNQDSSSDVVKREAYEGVTKDLHKFKSKAKEEAAARAELEVRLKAIEEEKLKEQEQYKELYEKRNQELEQIKQSAEAEKSKYLKSVKMAALKSELGGKVRDQYLIHADIDSIEFNEDGSLNPESVKAIANDFRENHSSLIPSGNSSSITNQAPSSDTPAPTSLGDLSVAQKMALLNRK
jgi:hypothetical protein